MNTNLLLIGLVAFLLGLIAELFDNKRSARVKKDNSIGYTEAQFKYSKWTLIVVGLFMIIYSFLNSEYL